MRGVGWEAHVTSRDPTLDKGRAPARSGVACPKNVQWQYLTCPSELVQIPKLGIVLVLVLVLVLGALGFRDRKETDETNLFC
jgi:hypothetical protein